MLTDFSVESSRKVIGDVNKTTEAKTISRTNT